MQHSLVSGKSEEPTEIAPVADKLWNDFVSWIDPLRDPPEVESTVAELRRRISATPGAPLPLEATKSQQRISGAYILMMGARVASVGGVRAIDNHTVTAANLLEQLVSDARRLGAVQIQAVVDGDDSALTSIVELAGFSPLAELQQVWLPLTGGAPAGNASDLPTGLVWRSATQIPEEQVTALLGQTFVETLDCPALNGVRTSRDILEGFLDGQSLHEQQGWWLLEKAGKLIGCSLINRLASGAGELVYLGLVPGARGRGYGKHLLDQGVTAARQLACDMVLAAVDCDNWPAVRMYAQRGFQERGRVQAWFHQIQRI